MLIFNGHSAFKPWSLMSVHLHGVPMYTIVAPAYA